MTPDQKEILDFAHRQGGYFTKAEAVRKFGEKYYNNADKYVGERLSRMVSTGLLDRVKGEKGRYKAGKGTKNKPATIDDGQIELF